MGAAATPVPGPDAWVPWTPEEVAARLAGVDVPWCVIGGWAVDLFLGAPSRPHHDVEIAVAPPDLAAVRDALTGCVLHPVGDHQNWVLDPAAGAWRLDVMVEPGDAATWVFRRDPAIRAPRAEVVARTAAGIPYARPPAVLLYKAKGTRPQDEADLAACLPRLAASDRVWLATALRRAHPDHPWIDRLTTR